MADLKRKFRAQEGLDAAGEKVINVQTADRTVPSDGVNVEFLVQENTLQQYDETRWYPKDFAVIYDNRIWVSNREIVKPSGAFNELFWTALRTDAKWKTESTGTINLKSGDFISADTSGRGTIKFVLPSAPQDGDTIFIKDIGGQPGYADVTIDASVQSIVWLGAQVRSVRMTHPYSQMVLVFSNRLWQLYISDNERTATTITPASIHEAQANEFIVRRYTTGAPIRVTLPKFANDGDIINFTDMDGMNPLFHMFVSTYDDNTSIGSVGTTSLEVRSSGDGFIVFDAVEKLWRVWDGDLRTRLRIIKEDTEVRPNDHVMVFGTNNSTVKKVVITLPPAPGIGDTVKISLNYMRKGQTVDITCTGTDTIATSVSLLQFPKRSEYPPDATWVQNQTLSFNGDTSYVPVLDLSYIEDGGLKYWVVSDNKPTVERVDSKTDATRARLGVIALATEAQAMVDHENNPEKELAITPETFAKRVATKLRRGIARLVTLAEIQAPTTGPHLDDVIVTPAMLNEKTATETRRGVAEIATQSKTDGSTDDVTIVTPKKLHNRKASEILTGILALVKTGITTVAGVDRDTKGTNVYDNTENTKAVTPASLFENKATYTSQGGTYLATENEVINGTAHDPKIPTAVTPVELHKKTATEGRIGFTEIATQPETDAGNDDFRYITPKKLSGRKATQDLTGLARIATQPEFNAGALDDVISTPFKIKTYFSDPARHSVEPLSGLVESGNSWDHYKLDIKKASETQRGTLAVATKILVDAGVDDQTIITPKKLQDKKTSETTEGIIQIATRLETTTGTVGNKAVPPVHLKYAIQEQADWEATPTRRGPVKLTELALTFVGDKVTGSGVKFNAVTGLYENDDVKLNAGNYFKTGYAVSPFEMNKTLQNFLPINAIAVDSQKLDGLDSLQFIRRDIDQTVNGSLTLTKQLNTSAPLVSSSTSKFTNIMATIDLTVGDDSSHSVINLNAKGNHWLIDAQSQSTYLDFTADADVLRLKRDGDVEVGQTLKAGNRIDAMKGFSVEGGTMVINPTPSNIQFGSQSKATNIQTTDASNLTVTDSTGTSTVITTKNMVNQIGLNFVKKIGDSMTGNLLIDATLRVQIPEGVVTPDQPPTDSNPNAWSSSIKTSAVYNKLPGFVVPVYGTNEEGNPVAIDYTEVKGPGTLTQHGIDKNSIWQIWAPRPATVDATYFAQTFWIRNFNALTGKWDKWGRMYTSNNPPTSKEIGAVAAGGSAFDNLTIRDWLQIGNVRITPNPVTQTVDFTWIP
ncbi:tail fiber protein proximal subunit [Citrobacter phage CF1 ERZ-2017]|uniref:Long tail fiber proximal subunit n=1 Tax=Citrobacter phage CF1 ERZ-2017 TaxID=2267236 RepID=A0A2H4YG54_9CAUD|nr:tail fiber protein proximal subunit [Citrobacter phage CF1 ERZ-2017]AUE23150.1 long tail fiber proximal subunit [Citrobacter phage CF1 ERZ-2017]